MLLYGGSAYSYALDPAFSFISKSEKHWQGVIDTYYEKYKGVKKWHNKIIREVIESKGTLSSPTGREYKFQRFSGEFKDTQIKNYGVQGLGADLMAIARVSAFNRIKKLGYGDKCLFVNTIHDSIILDFDEKVCYTPDLIRTLQEVFQDIPSNYKKLFGQEFNVPMAGEIMMGQVWESRYDKNVEVNPLGMEVV